MTKQEAEAEYREQVLPGVRKTYERDGRVDIPARAEAWNNFVDYLHQDRRVTRKQADTWTHPRSAKGYRAFAAAQRMMRSGYAYKLRSGHHPETVMLSEVETSKGKFLGYINIDGQQYDVYQIGRSRYAQLHFG